MASIDDILAGEGPGDTALSEFVEPPELSDYILGLDPADYAHMGAALGREYDGQHAVLTVRDVSTDAAALAAAGEALASVLEGSIPTIGGVPFSALAASGVVVATTSVVFTTDKFILSSIVEPRAARSAMAMSFNQPSIYSSGMRPYFFRYAGRVLINKLDGDGRNSFFKIYRQYLRATAGLVGKARRAVPWLVELTYRDAFRAGYVTDVSLSINALEPTKADMSFTFFVIEDRFV